MHPFVDVTLSRRLERTEAHSNAAFVEARAALEPALGASWIEVEGTYAMFDGTASPLTQTFGLGVFAEPTVAQLDALEAFFAGRGAPVFHEVSPLAAPSHLGLLADRGYRPVELTSVLVRPIDEGTGAGGDVSTRPVTRAEADAWADASAAGWSDTPELADFLRGLGRVAVRAAGTSAFVAEREGRVVGTGALHVHEGVALLAGASTLPAERGRGVQRELLAARLRFARAAGCSLAMMCAEPGGVSQRNAERQGFRTAYTRIKWARA